MYAEKLHLIYITLRFLSNLLIFLYMFIDVSLNEIVKRINFLFEYQGMSIDYTKVCVN